VINLEGCDGGGQLLGGHALDEVLGGGGGDCGGDKLLQLGLLQAHFGTTVVSEVERAKARGGDGGENGVDGVVVIEGDVGEFLGDGHVV